MTEVVTVPLFTLCAVLVIGLNLTGSKKRGKLISFSEDSLNASCAAVLIVRFELFVKPLIRPFIELA